MKKILITAGTVYGRLDDNKLVGNRARGIWAQMLADVLTDRGHDVTLLVADTQRCDFHETESLGTTLVPHTGFWDYREKCLALAPELDAAVMAAAVVNWIPRDPFPGKMPTAGYEPGDVLDVPFVLAPRVIDEMRATNPRMTLVGCKMTAGATEDELLAAAYKVLRDARAHLVVANDLHRLKRKILLSPDGRRVDLDLAAGGGDDFTRELVAALEDSYFSTRVEIGSRRDPRAETTYEAVVNRHRLGFTPHAHAFGRLAGAVMVRGTHGGAICTQRRKAALDLFPERAVWVLDVDPETRQVVTMPWLRTVRASMAAPLLYRVLQAFPHAAAVLHQHRQLDGAPVVPYAPSGTVRDYSREIPGPVFNVEGHGFFAAVDEMGGILWT